jgi:bacteriocin-like protein
MSQAKIERDARTSSSGKSISKRAGTKVEPGIAGRELSDTELAAVSGGKDIESIYNNTYGFAQK